MIDLNTRKSVIIRQVL